jgi:hypothetical protein
MKAGFYDLSKIKTNETLKKFFTDAIFLSYNTHIDILDCKESFYRQSCTTKTIIEMLDNVNISYHNVCIDRSVQHSKNEYGEIGYCTMGDPDYFLYIYISLDNLQFLIDKYKLKIK